MSLRLVVQERQWSARVQRFVQAQSRTVDRLVFETAQSVLDDIVQGWPVDSGISRAAWRGPVRAGLLAWRLTNPMPYAQVIEFGGYPGVGPKTERIGQVAFPGGIRVGAGIFPTQKPHAPVRRALSSNRDVLLTKIRQAIRQQWGVT